jgi:hypothetical protein
MLGIFGFFWVGSLGIGALGNWWRIFWMVGMGFYYFWHFLIGSRD